MSMGIACSSRYFGKIGSWCTRSIRNTRSFCQHHLGMDILQLQEPWATEWFQSRWITAVVTTHSSGTRKATLAWGPCGGWKHGAGWYSDKTSDGHMFFPFLYWDCVELGLVVFFYNCRHAQKTVVMRVFVHIVHFGRLAHTHTHILEVWSCRTASTVECDAAFETSLQSWGGCVDFKRSICNETYRL